MIGAGIGGAVPNCPVISRKVLTFNGTNAYGTLSEPIVLSGDFEIEIVFSTVSSSGLNILVGLSTGSDSYIYVDGASGTIRARTPTNKNITGTVTVNDGTVRTVKLVRTSLLQSLYVDGAIDIADVVAESTSCVLDQIGKNSFGNYFNGKIYSIKITDNSGAASIVYEYQLNNGRTDYQLPSGKSSPQINWSNITESDYTRYVLHRDFSPARWVSESDGSYIEVAT